jgi:hypothetical protein
MKQSTINDFFTGTKNSVKKVTKKKKIKFIVKSNLNINIEEAKQKINMLPNIVKIDNNKY